VAGALLAAESIKAARPLAAHDYANMPPEELAQFFLGLHPSTLHNGWKLADVIDFSKTRHLVDVGGGSGAMAIALCGRCPGMRATVVDLPQVVPVARAYVESSGLRDRIDVQSGDVLQTALEGAYDAAVLRNFLQVFSRVDCLPALQNIRQALVPGAQIAVMGQIANDDHTTPETMPLFDLVFLSFYGEGRVYTEGEYRGWLSNTGFVNIRRHLTANGLNMLTATMPS
jgi:cyclopropane fatty-acyl-phospholipid synthase-like methyltransferase